MGHGHLGDHQDPGSLPARLLCSQVPPACIGLFLSIGKILHLFLLILRGCLFMQHVMGNSAWQQICPMLQYSHATLSTILVFPPLGFFQLC